MVACRTATGRRDVIQERATKICLVGPLGVSVAQGAVARWDGNVALQRWGCGRCRPGHGGRGYHLETLHALLFRGYRNYCSEQAFKVSFSSFTPSATPFPIFSRLVLANYTRECALFFNSLPKSSLDDWSRMIILRGWYFFEKKSNF